MATITTWKERMEKAGFKNVKQETYKVCPYRNSKKKNPAECIYVAATWLLAKRPQTERNRYLPPAQHARCHGTLYVCTADAVPELEKGGGGGFADWGAEGDQGSVDP